MPDQQAPRITIRPATMNDVSQIVAMDQELFGWYGANEEPEIIRARLEGFPQGCAIMEEHRDNTPPIFLGYVTTEKWDSLREPVLDENPHMTHKPHGQVLNITTLAIGQSFQNRGLGSRLLSYTIDFARSEGCQQIILETARAQRFYLRHGFETASERTQRGITLYVMTRSLAQNRS